MSLEDQSPYVVKLQDFNLSQRKFLHEVKNNMGNQEQYEIE